jgi:hypothetical protein
MTLPRAQPLPLRCGSINRYLSAVRGPTTEACSADRDPAAAGASSARGAGRVVGVRSRAAGAGGGRTGSSSPPFVVVIVRVAAAGAERGAQRGCAKGHDREAAEPALRKRQERERRRTRFQAACAERTMGFGRTHVAFTVGTREQRGDHRVSSRGAVFEASELLELGVIARLVESSGSTTRANLPMSNGLPGGASTRSSRSRRSRLASSSARWWQRGLLPARPKRLNAVQVQPARHSFA